MGRPCSSGTVVVAMSTWFHCKHDFPRLLFSRQCSDVFSQSHCLVSPTCRVNISFSFADGSVKTVKAKVGDSLLDVVIDENVDMDGFGETPLSCALATCCCVAITCQVLLMAFPLCRGLRRHAVLLHLPSHLREEGLRRPAEWSRRRGDGHAGLGLWVDGHVRWISWLMSWTCLNRRWLNQSFKGCRKTSLQFCSWFHLIDVISAFPRLGFPSFGSSLFRKFGGAL